MATASVSLVAGLYWLAGLYLGWRIVRRLLAPLARMWRERPVVIWSEENRRWEAARRMSRSR